MTRKRLACVLALLGCSEPRAPGDELADASETGTETTDGTSESDVSDSETGESGETGETCEPARPSLVEREFLRAGEGREAIAIDACEAHVWWVAAADDTELTVTIASAEPVEIAISYPDAIGFADRIASTTVFLASGELSFVSPRSGEFAVLIRPVNPGGDPTLAFDYDITLACSDECGRETTRFPIVLIHGWTGFENIGPIDYFFGVRDQLEPLGYPVHVAVLDPYNSVEVRGQQLAEVADLALVLHRARKLGLIAHSQGGLDARRMISGLGYGDRIAGLITVATPHRGTPLTDVALGLLPGSSDEALYFLLNLIGAGVDQQSDAEASFLSLSETFVQGSFNPAHPDDPRVRYWSWTGETCLSLLTCDDAVDAPILLGYELLAVIAGPNDGLVPVTSGEWGEFLGVIAADHFDEVGQVGGATGPNFDHLEFYLDNARLLRGEAL